MTERSLSFAKNDDDKLVSILSACNVYKIDNGHFSHVDGAVFRRSSADNYYTITANQDNLFSKLDTNAPFVGGFVK